MAHSGGGGSFEGDYYSDLDFDYSDYADDDDEFYYPSTARGQSTYRPGANRYVYYYRKKSHIYYSDSPLTEEDYRRDGVVFLVISFIFTAIWLWIAVGVTTEMSHSGKLEQNYNAEICIDDDARLIEDKQKLIEELEEFWEETGISVAVKTRRYCYYMPMREYALDEYYRHFEDESHWLIYYVGTEANRTDEWAWELVCGDDCIMVLDNDQENRFTQEFQNGYTIRKTVWMRCLFIVLSLLNRDWTGMFMAMGKAAFYSGFL